MSIIVAAHSPLNGNLGYLKGFFQCTATVKAQYCYRCVTQAGFAKIKYFLFPQEAHLYKFLSCVYFQCANPAT